MTEDEKQEAVDPRILFAAERTLFAYIRTGLALMGFGFVVARFGLFLRQLSAVAKIETTVPAPISPSAMTGIFLILCGVAMCAYAPIWYRNTVLRLRSGTSYTSAPFGLASTVAVLLAAVGVLTAVYLFSLL